MPFVRVYVFELLLRRCLSGPGYSGLALLGYCCAMNQALRIPIAFNYNGLRLPEGGDFEAIHRVKPSETLIEAQSFI